MSDSQLHPFERMNYFPGQLLMARHFKAEQSYMNEKRHLLNRLIHGRGIVCGLIVKEDACIGKSREITITPGVALDGYGREVIVHREITMKISEIESCDSSQEKPESFYLCLEYAECKKEPVPNLNSCSCEETCEYSRIQEGFKIVIREKEPPQNNCCTPLKEGQTLKEYAASMLYECPKPSKNECVILASICLDPEGYISSVNGKGRQYVYSNSLLYEHIFCIEERICKIERVLNQLLDEKKKVDNNRKDD
ncbi:hypothetical protein EXW29_09615 [Bacillus toyonensis]|uniref:hypothetical protein n=1 Tax=Bacillus toyonensis TaxID=155322 RepID=UPI001C01B927|nr:hypothetical protein [Bacillus toyonensis]QWH88430.1 hypothetical protein EXW29_09615 [Bacillus toyonensis]QWI31605.1 hypothetical protein EXW25_09605 [Bacillus toyonensis]